MPTQGVDGAIFNVEVLREDIKGKSDAQGCAWAPSLPRCAPVILDVVVSVSSSASDDKIQPLTASCGTRRNAVYVHVDSQFQGLLDSVLILDLPKSYESYVYDSTLQFKMTNH